MSARILLIEDNRANLDLMIYLLKAFGHKPEGLTDPIAGLDAACSGEYDLIVSDVLMPGMDGYELARRLKANPKTGRRKLVAVTAVAMVGDRERLLAAGFDGYIAKPIDPTQFVSQVEQYLPDQLRSTAARTGTQAAPQPETAPEEGPVILVVDDTEVNRRLVRSTLVPFGYRVVEAQSVKEALERIGELKPALVLCDVHMPDGNGSELLAKMKATADLARIPFLFLTATAWQTEERRRGMALGADGFLLRPIDPSQLIKAVSDSLNTIEDESGGFSSHR